MDENESARLAAALDLPPEIATLLLRRGRRELGEIEAFLNPSLSLLPPATLLKGMEEATAILEKCVKEKRPVGIYGDYDVDGITGSAVLYLFLKEIGLEVSCYQPDRLREGYGLHEHGIRQLHAENLRNRGEAGVLLSVDCGISGHDAVVVARQLGFTVIITDHHRPPDLLPPADAIINPMQPGCLFPDKNLAGVGVAFYLIMGLRSRLFRHGFWPAEAPPNLKNYLDLVALGTVADQVELTGVNRILVKAGLQVMNEKMAAHALRPGVRQLIKTARTGGREMSVEDFAFRLAPRINAAGRIGKPDAAMRLLISNDSGEGERLAAELEEANRLRRELEQQLLAATLEQAEQDVRDGRRTLVLAGDNWHSGVIGIVATRLMERFFRPTVLVSFSDDIGTGSARSIPGLHLYETLEGMHDVLERYGGHEMAAGMTVRRENFQKFRERFEARAIDRLDPEDLAPKLLYDHSIAMTRLADSLFLRYYERLSPFGTGNPEPLFLCRGVRLTQPRLVGGTHLRCRMGQGDVSMAGIGFGLGHLLDNGGLPHHEVDVAVRLRVNEYWSSKEWELNLVDIRETAVGGGQ